MERFASSEQDCAVADQSDEESKFSEVDKSDESKEDNEEWREVERRRLDSSVEENSLNTAFWTVNREDIMFTQDAFLNKSLFHLNSFLIAKKWNTAFSLFLREGVATPGFYPVPTSIEVDRIADLTYAQLVDVLMLEGDYENDTHGASQTAKWLKYVNVGSFVVMRHEYPKCKFCPKRLKNELGEYIGPVYVIGIVTKKIKPWSVEERDVANNKMDEFRVVTGANHIHNLCRVEWKRMGYKRSLKDSTQNYINHVCQPTLQRICHDLDKSSHVDIRRDLWMNATIRIRSDDFPDRFDYTGLA